MQVPPLPGQQVRVEVVEKGAASPSRRRGSPSRLRKAVNWNAPDRTGPPSLLTRKPSQTELAVIEKGVRDAAKRVRESAGAAVASTSASGTPFAAWKKSQGLWFAEEGAEGRKGLPATGGAFGGMEAGKGAPKSSASASSMSNRAREVALPALPASTAPRTLSLSRPSSPLDTGVRVRSSASSGVLGRQSGSQVRGKVKRKQGRAARRQSLHDSDSSGGADLVLGSKGSLREAFTSDELSLSATAKRRQHASPSPSSLLKLEADLEEWVVQ
jgi:hypothetical protein